MVKKYKGTPPGTLTRQLTFCWVYPQSATLTGEVEEISYGVPYSIFFSLFFFYFPSKTYVLLCETNLSFSPRVRLCLTWHLKMNCDCEMNFFCKEVKTSYAKQSILLSLHKLKAIWHIHNSDIYRYSDDIYVYTDRQSSNSKCKSRSNPTATALITDLPYFPELKNSNEVIGLFLLKLYVRA